MYGFKVGDKVTHINDQTAEGYCMGIDYGHDTFGQTTCSIVWNVSSYEEAKENNDRVDTQWTNKIIKYEK